jgi:parvulin-like peptidyl-prolyl isomerase
MLADDGDQAQRLISELRLRRGLGQERFAHLLHRSAALRLLVQTQVEISDAAVQQAFELQHGSRYEARLIVTATLADAAKLVHRARQGESFIDLAIAHSTDASRAQGGLLPPISPVDPTFPDVIRAALGKMQDQQVSDPISLEQGFAILKLEKKIPADAVKFDDVKDQLALKVRRQVEDMLMRRMRAVMVSEADIVILDPALNESWQAWSRTNTP